VHRATAGGGLTGPVEDETTTGSLTLILQALFSAGIELRPESPPAYVTDKHLDAFDSFPFGSRRWVP